MPESVTKWPPQWKIGLKKKRVSHNHHQPQFNIQLDVLHWKKTQFLRQSARAHAHTRLHTWWKTTVAQSVSVLRSPGRFPMNSPGVFFFRKNMVKPSQEDCQYTVYVLWADCTTRKLSSRRNTHFNLSRQALFKRCTTALLTHGVRWHTPTLSHSDKHRSKQGQPLLFNRGPQTC